ncbi:MAG: hypothetical protein H0A75_03005 [Candidatus Methanofishera endochildressiae]|uniref:Uncharacterized protein n=1 Tax=Candidatus Methanofishera endochildressiae TaxID=2738884 RepID=A0A7Z0MN49_9GAMM|nr:hypothetical protein [Candidatus Methanofishera endochildressiae]
MFRESGAMQVMIGAVGRLLVFPAEAFPGFLAFIRFGRLGVFRRDIRPTI